MDDSGGSWDVCGDGSHDGGGPGVWLVGLPCGPVRVSLGSCLLRGCA